FVNAIAGDLRARQHLTRTGPKRAACPTGLGPRPANPYALRARRAGVTGLGGPWRAAGIVPVAVLIDAVVEDVSPGDHFSLARPKEAGGPTRLRPRLTDAYALRARRTGVAGLGGPRDALGIVPVTVFINAVIGHLRGRQHLSGARPKVA